MFWLHLPFCTEFMIHFWKKYDFKIQGNFLNPDVRILVLKPKSSCGFVTVKSDYFLWFYSNFLKKCDFLTVNYGYKKK